ncbi:MAG: YerC/YecD family TrpR-related protein [Clostridia bacterium]|nr:YerC/YecD family TrpR-related protein [Clostridia bacterium]
MENYEKIDKDEARRQLCDCFASISDAQDIDKLLADLCTYTELEQMAQRLMCAKLLLEGRTYNEIIEVTEVSSATLSRVSRCIRHGSGGYSGVLAQVCDCGKKEG